MRSKLFETGDDSIIFSYTKKFFLQVMMALRLVLMKSDYTMIQGRVQFIELNIKI